MSRSAWLRVGDMVDAAKMAVAWTEGLDRAVFLSDDLRKSGVQWQLLVLGEAAKAVPADIQALEPGSIAAGRRSPSAQADGVMIARQFIGRGLSWPGWRWARREPIGGEPDGLGWRWARRIPLGAEPDAPETRPDPVKVQPLARLGLLPRFRSLGPRSQT